jgi:hypothetical protein
LKTVNAPPDYVPAPPDTPDVGQWQRLVNRPGWFRYLLDDDGERIGVQMVEGYGKVWHTYSIH